MPELPEVEHVARQLRAELVGRRIVSGAVSWPRAIVGMEPSEFEGRVRNRLVTGIGRRGKHLTIALDDGETLVIHRRMSGNLVFMPPAEHEAYARVVFTLDDGRRLLYTDPRKFGRMSLLNETELVASFAALGPEPLALEFSPAVLAERLAGRNSGLKALLLDQSVVVGLGNIYADEALYRAKLHPLRRANSLTPEEIAALHAGIQGALQTGIEHGGTTFGQHRGIYSEAGSNLEHVEVYRRTGKPCLRCGTSIQRITVAQRGTHFCPNCQRLAAGEAEPVAE